jgi:hypothetical protein
MLTRILAVTLITTSLAPLAFARGGILPTLDHRRPAVRGTTQKTLKYFGGPVIANAKVVAVFWGKNVNSVITRDIGAFYSTIANSTYLDWLSEYDTFDASVSGKPGTRQHIGRGSLVGEYTISPKHQGGMIDDTEIQSDLADQIALGTLPAPDANTVYMLYFPPFMRISAFGATSCVEFCAYHSFHGTPEKGFYYGVMPDLSQASCGNGCQYGFNEFASTTSVSGHEFIEAITDPFPTPGTQPGYPQAWNDDQGNEIADLCAGTNNIVTSSKGTYTVSSEWDNNANGCTDRTWTSP